MNRRNFISHFGKFSLATATAGVAVSAAAQGKDLVKQSSDQFSCRIDALKTRIDKLEDNQKNFLKVFFVVTALSTGIDLSIII
jgi:hypothetical protein